MSDAFDDLAAETGHAIAAADAAEKNAKGREQRTEAMALRRHADALRARLLAEADRLSG